MARAYTVFNFTNACKQTMPAFDIIQFIHLFLSLNAICTAIHFQSTKMKSRKYVYEDKRLNVNAMFFFVVSLSLG